MNLKEITLINFRNYDKIKISFNSKINIIYGDNAQGKTNLLESIYFLGMTKSHRSFIDDNLIKKNCTQSKVSGLFKVGDFNKKFEIFLDQGKKKLKIDNNDIKRVNEYLSNINIIIFYPEDLEIIKDGPEARRKYLNIELSQLYNSYIKILADFNKLLRVRNEYLKKKAKNISVDDNYFEILTNYYINKAILIYRMRYKFICKINEYTEKIFCDITGIKGFYIKYIPNIKFENFENETLKKELKLKLDQNLNNDIKNNSSLFGPHRDDFECYINDENVKNYGSQGQQRAAILAIKLSEIYIFENYKGEKPILLLDDVFSELDDIKKNNLLKYIKKDIQTIITTTDLKNISPEIIKKAKKYKIKEGRIEKTKEV